MADTAWIENMKKIALQAMEAGDPCNLVFGVVVSVSPPEIRLDQKITVKGKQLTVPARFTDHTETMVIPELGEVSVTVKGSLKPGERVMLLQQKGGQLFLVLERC